MDVPTVDHGPVGRRSDTGPQYLQAKSTAIPGRSAFTTGPPERLFGGQFGLMPVGALRAVKTDARAFFGAASIEAGGPADVVTFEQDPRDDPAVLSRPAAVVLRGIRIA